MMLLPCSCVICLLSDEIERIDKVQSTFWGEWKIKLEQQKHVADRSRALEKVIAGKHAPLTREMRKRRVEGTTRRK